MSVSTQANLLEVMAQAAAASPPHARWRPGLGPPLLCQLRRLLPLPPPLQPAWLALAGGGRLSATGAAPGARTGIGGTQASGSPFIFSAVTAAAAKRQAAGGGGGAGGPGGTGDAPPAPDWVRGRAAARSRHHAAFVRAVPSYCQHTCCFCAINRSTCTYRRALVLQTRVSFSAFLGYMLYAGVR